MHAWWRPRASSGRASPPFADVFTQLAHIGDTADTKGQTLLLRTGPERPRPLRLECEQLFDGLAAADQLGSARCRRGGGGAPPAALRGAPPAPGQPRRR